jgi:hypothetical protein
MPDEENRSPKQGNPISEPDPEPFPERKPLVLGQEVFPERQDADQQAGNNQEVKPADYLTWRSSPGRRLRTITHDRGGSAPLLVQLSTVCG